jgi:membrane-associated phospholipid phosphatase
VHSFDSGSRRRLAAVAVGLFAGAALLGLRVEGGTGPLRVDQAGSRVLQSRRLAAALARHHLGRLDSPQLFDRLVWLGSPFFVAIAALGFCLWAWRRRDRLGAAVALLGPFVALFITEVVAKPIVDRTKGNGLAYPSGHVTGATALAAVAVVLAYRHWGHRYAVRVAVVVAALPLLVGAGVVRLGWHYATDVVGGLAVGTAGVLGVAVALSALEARQRVESPA